MLSNLILIGCTKTLLQKCNADIKIGLSDPTAARSDLLYNLKYFTKKIILKSNRKKKSLGCEYELKMQVTKREVKKL